MSALADLVTLESAAVVAAASALCALVAKAWPRLNQLSRFMDEVLGVPARAGVEARPGWGERLAGLEDGQRASAENQEDILVRLIRVEDRTERIRAQTENSHATNLRDDLDAVAAKVDDLHHRHVRTTRKDRP